MSSLVIGGDAMCRRRGAGSASAQLPANQLPRRGPRELGDELEALRDLEIGERAGAMAVELIGVEAGSAPGYDNGDHRLLPLGVGAADGGGVEDVAMTQQHLLDLRRDHVRAAGA